MNFQNAKIGDTVTCIDNEDGCFNLTVGKDYKIVSFFVNRFFRVADDKGYLSDFLPRRFKAKDVAPVVAPLPVVPITGVCSQATPKVFTGASPLWPFSELPIKKKQNMNITKKITLSPLRDTKGRFRSTQPVKIVSGCLYKVICRRKPSFVARFRSKTYQDNVVVTVHNKAVVVKASQLRLASKAECAQYLALAKSKA